MQSIVEREKPQVMSDIHRVILHIVVRCPIESIIFESMVPAAVLISMAVDIGCERRGLAPIFRFEKGGVSIVVSIIVGLRLL